MIKAVFFDWYNTLVHHEPPRDETQVIVCRLFGINVNLDLIRRALPVADDYFYQENLRLPVEQRSKEEKAEVYAAYENMILKGAGVDVPKDKVLHILGKLQQTPMKLTLYDDVIPTLTELKRRGLVLGMISNADRSILATCNEFNLTSHLDFMVTPQEAGSDKPNPPIFLAALKRAGVKAPEAIHIGDQYQYDVIGARAVGIKAVLIDRDGIFDRIRNCTRIRSLSEAVALI